MLKEWLENWSLKQFLHRPMLLLGEVRAKANKPISQIELDNARGVRPTVPRFYIGIWQDQYSFNNGGESGWFPKHNSATRILKILVYYHADTLTSVERIAIEVSGEEIDAIGDSVDDSVGTQITNLDFFFQIPSNINQGKRDVLLKGFSAGQWWPADHAYSIVFPKP